MQALKTLAILAAAVVHRAHSLVATSLEKT